MVKLETCRHLCKKLAKDYPKSGFGAEILMGWVSIVVVVSMHLSDSQKSGPQFDQRLKGCSTGCSLSCATSPSLVGNFLSQNAEPLFRGLKEQKTSNHLE